MDQPEAGGGGKRVARLRALYRAGFDLGATAEGLADFLAGRDTAEGEAAGMLVAEFLSVMVRANTEKG